MTPWFLGLRNYKNGIAIFLQWGSQKKTKMLKRVLVMQMKMQSRQLDNQVCGPYRRSGLEI